jgi:hypothetical protein
MISRILPPFGAPLINVCKKLFLFAYLFLVMGITCCPKTRPSALLILKGLQSVVMGFDVWKQYQRVLS